MRAYRTVAQVPDGRRSPCCSLGVAMTTDHPDEGMEVGNRTYAITVVRFADFELSPKVVHRRFLAVGLPRLDAGKAN